MAWQHALKTPIFWVIAWIAFLLSTAASWVVWYLLIFTPVHVVQSGIELDGRNYTVTVFSHKTFFANTLCGKPLSTGSVIAFQDESQNHATVPDNAKGQGNGDEQIRKWESTGIVPDNIEAGPVVAWKRLLYLCAGGIIKEVETPEHPFILTE